MCTLLIDGDKTGNIRLDNVTKAAMQQPKKHVAEEKASPSSVLASPEPDVHVLAIGASQDPTAQAKALATQADVDLRILAQHRYVPRRALTRGANALPDTLKDVVEVKEWMEEQPGVAEVTRFVGRDDTNSLTRYSFLNKVDRLLDQPGKVFILYYAGHGTEGDPSDEQRPPGAFCMQKDGYVTLDDLINVWAGAQVTARRGQRFLIIADSCFSGSLVTQLRNVHRAREREGLPNLNMAVQSACGENELSSGGVFTHGFITVQSAGGFDWSGCVPSPEFCASCRTYFSTGCKTCRRLHEEQGFPRNAKDVQHPGYFATWGGNRVSADGFELRLFRR